MAELRLSVTLDRDWLRLNIYRMALEVIMERHAEEPWGFTGEEAAALAEIALTTFPEEPTDV